MDEIAAEVKDVCKKLGVSIDTAKPKISCAAKDAWSRECFT